MIMKKTILIFSACLLVLFAGCANKSSTEKNSENNKFVAENENPFPAELCGRWVCELYSSSKVIEFTDDGKFISYSDKGIYIDYDSYDVSNYRVENGVIVTYVEGFEDYGDGVGTFPTCYVVGSRSYDQNYKPHCS